MQCSVSGCRSAHHVAFAAHESEAHQARTVVTSLVVLVLRGKIERWYDSVIGQPRIVVETLHVGIGDSVKQAHAAPVLRCEGRAQIPDVRALGRHLGGLADRRLLRFSQSFHADALEVAFNHIDGHFQISS
jgi:hypothetical protein